MLWPAACVGRDRLPSEARHHGRARWVRRCRIDPGWLEV